MFLAQGFVAMSYEAVWEDSRTAPNASDIPSTVVKREVFICWKQDPSGESLGSFQWCSPALLPSIDPAAHIEFDSSRCFPLSDTRDVYVGKQTGVMLSAAAEVADEDRCLSMASATQTLNLELESAELVDTWMTGFKHILTCNGVCLFIAQLQQQGLI